MRADGNDIVEALRNNPERGFRLLMDRYKEAVYWHIRRLVVSHADAQDATQETFVRVFRSLGQFRDDMRTKVVRRALTKAGRRANTEAVRAVRAEYKVPAKAVRKALTTRVSTDDAMEVALSLKGSPTPLADLSPRAYGGPSGWPTRGGKGKVRRPGGVTVKIKGKKYKIPHAFIATMSSGHVGVFARGGRSKVAAPTGETYGSFSFSSQRLPITELFTFSLAQAFRNDKVLRQVVQRVTRDFSGLLAHEIEWQLGKMK